VSNEEAKQIEISKLQKMLEALNLELDAAKLATINECNKNAVLQNQLELSAKEKSALKRELAAVDEVRKENAALKVSLDSFEKKYVALELQLMNAQKGRDETIEKLRELEQKCSQLEQNVKSLEEKLLSLEDENHVLRQKALSAPPKSNRTGFAKSLSEKYSSTIATRTARKPKFESPTPTKLVAPFTLGSSDSHRSKLIAGRHQDYYEFLSRCIKENLGFKNGKPLAARIIYKCLLHWHAFESERTAIFDYIIEGINEVLKVRDDDIVLPYWLSNTSALLCILQRNLHSNGFLTSTGQRNTGSSGLTSRTGPEPKFPLKFVGYDDGMSHVEARYPAILFKQQLTACVEKIFGLLRDNLKKELSPLLGMCVQAPKTGRGHGGKSSRSPGGLPQQSSGGQWSNIVKFLDSIMDKLRRNHVPSFFIRKLVTQVFSFINITLFNSLLLRHECCTFSNGEYVKSGLSELEKWIVNAKEEYAGTSWHELNYIRQAVAFLVIHQKRKKSLEEIRLDLCPALTVRQIYRISTMYWDDKYGTQSVSNEVVSEMREIVSKDNQNLTSNSFLLDDDLSIPFSADDIDMAIPAIDPDDIVLPAFLSEYSCAQFLNSD
ncbi:myosin-15-like, partial [Gastrolobium bilobum]|uniref:myosin-15-like n=1 Tax=Gastrolobium bilobum TaxID=150636 RepID=UPI002AB26520